MSRFQIPFTLRFLAAALLFQHASSQDSSNLRDRFRPFVDRSELAGAVMLVADRNKILAHETVGYSNVEAKAPMRPDTLFWIASQSKPITGAAFMMLVDEGKVNLDDPVEKYLPEFSEQMVVGEKSEKSLTLVQPERPITIRGILSHTSGLPFKSALETPTLDRYPLEGRVRSYAMTPLESQPGVKFQYSNAGINTAARIIEVISGQSFEDFLQERIFDPLQMNDTTFWPSETQASRIALSYKPGPEKKGLEPLEIDQLKYPLSDRIRRFPVPAGGLFSSAEDVAKFYRMLLNNGKLDGKRLLSESAVSELSKKQTPDSIDKGYGLGFSVNGGSFGHGGAYSTNTTIETKPGLILIWLVQHAGFPGNGKECQGIFRSAALEKFSPRQP